MMLVNLLSDNSLYISRAISLLCHVGRIFLLTTILSASGYAEWGALIYLCQLLTLVTSFGLREGMYVATLRFNSTASAVYQSGFRIFFKIMPLGILFSVVSLGLLLGERLHTLILFRFYVALLLINDLLVQYCRIQERFSIIAIAEVALNLIPIALLAIFLPTRFDYLVCLLISGVGFSLGIFLYYCFSDLRGLDEKLGVRRFFEIGIPLTAVTFFSTTLNNGFLTVFLPSNFEQSLKGNIVLSNNIATAFLIIPTIFIWKYLSDLIRSSGAELRGTESKVLKNLSFMFVAISLIVVGARVAVTYNFYDIANEWVWSSAFIILPFVIIYKFTILLVGLDQARITAAGYDKTLLLLFGVFSLGIYPTLTFFESPERLALGICAYGTLFQVATKITASFITPRKKENHCD